MNSLKTGDLILFSGNGLFARFIEWVTRSDYSHCGIVLRDPTFIHPSLKGLYLWESGWEGHKDAENARLKMGVQIVPLHETLRNYTGNTYVRSLQTPSAIDDTVLETIHGLVHDRPYDFNPFDWAEALFREDPDPQKDDRMFCSAFVSLVYVKCGILSDTTDWSIVRPSDLATDNGVEFVEGCSLGVVKSL